jgi:peptidoglycan hydrolase CwlO-like protein
MKKSIIILMALSMFAVSVPAFAAEHEHGASHDKMDAQCIKDCELLIRNCALEVDSLQQKIKRYQEAIKKDGATQETREELQKIQKKLNEANETLSVLMHR